MSHEDRILIKQLRIKGHRSGKPLRVKRLQKEFPWKNWKSSTLKELLRKIDKIKVRYAISSPKISNKLKTKIF